MTKAPIVLIVDDEPLVHRLFGSGLARAGFEVLPAHDGMEGREIAMRMQPDIILLDQNMPVLDGVKTLAKLKSEELTRNIPVIFFTNEDLTVDAEKGIRDLGADDYLQKGTPMEEIIQRINILLDLSRKKQESLI